MKTDAVGNPILDQYSEEGFVDCVLQIVNLAESPAHYHFHLMASHRGEVVGFNVAVIKGIQSGFDADMNLEKSHVYPRGVVFSRSGPESDRLINGLSGLYGQTMENLEMKDEESFTAIALHQGPIDMTEQAIKIKIFGRDGPSDTEEEYYESFFNLDLKQQLVFWNEKDQEYRRPLILGLAK